MSFQILHHDDNIYIDKDEQDRLFINYYGIHIYINAKKITIYDKKIHKIELEKIQK